MWYLLGVFSYDSILHIFYYISLSHMSLTVLWFSLFWWQFSFMGSVLFILSVVLLFMIILVGFCHTLILVLLSLVTKLHFISENLFPCLTCYFPGRTGQSLLSLSALQSVCCSSVLFVMCCLLTLLWIRSENILGQVMLQDCWRATDLLQLKRS